MLIEAAKKRINRIIACLIRRIGLITLLDDDQFAQTLTHIGVEAAAHPNQHGIAKGRANRSLRQKQRDAKHIRLNLIPKRTACSTADRAQFFDADSGCAGDFDIVAEGEGGSFENCADQRAA